MSYAIFDNRNNCISIQNEIGNIESGQKCLEIGKDIQFQVIARQGGEILEIDKKDLKSKDHIIKNIYAIDYYDITRDSKRKKIKPKDLKKTDKIEQINYNKKDITGYKVCRGGKDNLINVSDIQPKDFIIKQFSKSEIMTNENNDFLIKE